MADIITITGEALDTSSPLADPDIQCVLDYYTEANKRGELKSIGVAAVTITDECVHYKSIRMNNHPMMLLGALEYLKDEILMLSRAYQEEIAT